MRSVNSATNMFDQPGFEYAQQLWGDLIYGTKEQLQSIGIAVGMSFPGEPDGPKRTLNVLDPRGLQCKIEICTHKSEGIYTASIRFPGRSTHKSDKWVEFEVGVKKSSDASWYDEYVGTPDALASAGLLRLDQLPGQPGMRKVSVRILPDGTLPKGAPTANCSEAKEPGAKWIKRIKRKSKTTYSVMVIVSEEEKCIRRKQHRRAQDEWEKMMRSLPRPAPLIPLPQDLRPVEKMPTLIKERSDGNVIYLRRAR